MYFVYSIPDLLMQVFNDPIHGHFELHPLLGRHGSVSLCRDERENKMAATYNVLAFKR